ncbi:MAG: alkaline phosphatase PhoX [Sandaracinaceae bacterium]
MLIAIGAIGALALTGCGEAGPAGPAGPEGPMGADGEDGMDGAPGMDGMDGAPGADGAPGMDGEDGMDGAPGRPGSDSLAAQPLSSMVALTLTDTAIAELREAGVANPTSVGEYVKLRARQFRDGTLPDGVQFPLENAFTDTMRTIQGVQSQVVISWLAPITDRPDDVIGPRWGANNDYLAYFGDGVDNSPDNGGPQIEGSSTAGFIWSNFEYVSSASPFFGGPEVGSAPARNTQGFTMALDMVNRGVFPTGFDVTDDAAWDSDALNLFIEEWRRNIGGGWVRIVQDPNTRAWDVDQRADNIRYDSTSNTRLLVTGLDFGGRTFFAEDGTELPAGVVPGIQGDCSGGITPWGTIITAEENVQSYFGDLEEGYSSQFLDPMGTAFEPGGPVDFEFTADPSSDFGRHSNPDFVTDRDAYGFLTEIDPGVAPDIAYDPATGDGHQKLGAVGRARWENTTFVVDDQFGLIDGQPIVLYGGNDRRGGRVWKWVSADNYSTGMDKATIRNLLDEGTLYVAHFADLDNDSGFTLDDGIIGEATGEDPSVDNRGDGRWIEISVDSDDVPPNQGTAHNSNGTETVGEALVDDDYNNIAAFPTDADVYRALFTVGNKLGVRETDRPEDLEWNPLDASGTPRLYIAFTNNGDDTSLNNDGSLSTIRGVDDSCASDMTNDCSAPSCECRARHRGSVFVLEEANPANPSASTTFTFWRAAAGTNDGDTNIFAFADVDNMMIDPEGGVWFGTDGNPGDNGQADALYYLDTDPDSTTFYTWFRVAGGPSNSEATGPATVPDMNTIFFNVQHPGEGSSVLSNWPPARR